MGLKEDLDKINKEIAKLSKELKVPKKVFDSKELKEAQVYASGLRSEIREMGGDLDYVAQSFKESVNELSKQNIYLNSAKSSLKGISGIAEKIVKYRQGETSLSEKQLKTLQQQAKAKFKELQNSVDSGQLKEKQLGEAEDSLQRQIIFNKSVEETIKLQKEVNKEIGLVGQGIGGVSKLLGKMGFGDMSQSLQDAIDKTKNAHLQQKLNNAEVEKLKEEYDEIKGYDVERKKVLRDQMSSLRSQNKFLDSQTSKYKNVGKALTGKLTKANLLDFTIGSIIKALTQADKETGELAKNMNMTYSEANKSREELTRIANYSGDSAVNTSRLQESLVATGQALGTNAKLNDQDLTTMTKLVNQAGYQHDEIMNIQKLSLTNGKTLEDNTKEILVGAEAYATRNGIVVNEKEVLKEVNKSSKALQLSLGQNTTALAESVVKAKQFGINLEQAEAIASSMLDFESSIEAELEAELLTGKNLNMERARQLALEGDIAGAAEEVLKQLEGSEEFSKMNVIQQEAMAKAVGMTREDLAASLIEREALAKIGAKDAEEARKKYDTLVEQHGVEEAQKMLGDEALAGQFQQQSIAERTGDIMSKLQEIFISMAPALLTIGDILSNIFSLVGWILAPVQMIFDAFTWIGESVGSFLNLLNQAMGGTKALAYIFKGLVIGAGLLVAYMAWASLSAIPIVGPVLGGIAAAAIIAGSFAAASKIKADDMVSPGGGGEGYGKRTLLAPEGAIQLNNKDTVIAGTNLFGDDVKSEPGKATEMAEKGEIKVKPEGGGAAPKVDMTQTNALLNQLISVIQSGGTVTLDGQKVGEALKLGTYSTQ